MSNTMAILVKNMYTYGFCAGKECFRSERDWLTRLVTWLETNIEDGEKGLAWNIENDFIHDTWTQQQLDEAITDMKGALKCRKEQLRLLDSE